MVEFFILLLLASLIILAFLISRLWALRRAAGSAELLLCALACGVWSFGYALEILVPGLAQKIFWAKFQYLGIATVSVWVLLFVLRYCGYITALNPRYVAALLVIPALTILFTATTELHGLMWTSMVLQPGWSMAPLAIEHGWWFWVEIGYAYLLLVAGTALMVQFIFRTQRLYLSQSLVMLASLLAPWLGNALYLIGARPGPNLDLTSIAFTISNTGLVVGFLGFRLLDILPVAYSSVFQFIVDGVVVLDTQERIVDINPAARRIFNSPLHALPTQPITAERTSRDPFIGSKMDEVYPGWKYAAQNESGLKMTLSPGKGSQTYTLRTTSILNRRQEGTGQVLIFTDISKLKQAEEQLKLAHEQALETNRMKTQLLANVSHDMRTPLGAISGFSEMLRDGVYGELTPEQKTAISDIQDSANELLMFVNNLIGQSQFDTGKILIKRKSFVVKDLIEACLSAVNVPASRKGLWVSYEVDPAVPQTMTGDPYWLRQIVLNLANNAVKFTDRGSVKIRVYLPEAGIWAIDVIDTGIGIPETAQAAIFEPFRQVDGSITRERGGSGLGLAIVKELTGLMGGQIVLSSRPGSGSTFTVCFPIIAKEEAL